MTISKSKQSIILEDKISTVVINPTEKSVDTTTAITVQLSGNDIFKNDILNVNLAGFYEAKDITVTSWKTTDTELQFPDIAVFNIEGCKVAYIRYDVSTISKDIVEGMGQIDILILEHNDSSKISSLVSDIEPSYTIVTGDDSEISSIYSKLAVVAEETKKLKVKSEEFNLENVEEVINKWIKLI